MKKLLLLIIFAMFCVNFYGCGKAELSKNELPMYGGLPRTVEEQKADDGYIAEMDRLGALEDKANPRKIAIKKTLQMAWGFYKRGDYKMAMKRFNQVWLLDNNNADAFFGFALIMEIYGKPDEAAKFYRKSIKISPSSDAAGSLAALLAKKALKDLERATSIAEKDKARKDLDEALALHAKSVDLADNDSDKGMAYYQWAIALFMDGKYAESWKKIKLSRTYDGKFIRPQFIQELSKKMPEPKE